MALKQEDALITALATGAVVLAVYQTHLPTVAGARASAQDNMHLGASRKSAALIAIGVVGAISLLSRSPTVFIVGGGTLVVLDVAHRLANATDHTSGKIPAAGTDQTAAPVS